MILLSSVLTVILLWLVISSDLVTVGFVGVSWALVSGNVIMFLIRVFMFSASYYALQIRG